MPWCIETIWRWFSPAPILMLRRYCLDLCVQPTLNASALVLLVDAFGNHAIKNRCSFTECVRCSLLLTGRNRCQCFLNICTSPRTQAGVMIATDIRLFCAFTRPGDYLPPGLLPTLNFDPVEITGKSRRENLPKMGPEVKDSKA